VHSGCIGGFMIGGYDNAVLEVILWALLLFALRFHSSHKPNEIVAFEGMSFAMDFCIFIEQE
jgi:hypothetical protein